MATAKGKRLTLIPVRPQTRERLKRLGRKGETYDSVITRLADERLFEVALPRYPPATREEIERENVEGEVVSLEELAERLQIVDILRKDYGIEI
jgi:hypothetical protein